MKRRVGYFETTCKTFSVHSAIFLGDFFLGRFLFFRFGIGLLSFLMLLFFLVWGVSFLNQNLGLPFPMVFNKIFGPILELLEEDLGCFVSVFAPSTASPSVCV